MKIIIALAALYTASVTIEAQSVILSSGESLDFNFSSLSFSSASSEPFGWFFEVTLVADFPGATGTLHIDLFDGTAANPFASTTMPGDATGFGFGSLAPTPNWDDMQGTVRFTMESGSVGLDNVTITKYLSGDIYRQTFSVPEPSSTALFLLGAGVILALSKRRKQIHGTHRNGAHRPRASDLSTGIGSVL